MSARGPVLVYYVLLLTAVLMIGMELFTSLRNQRTFHDGSAGAVWNGIYRWRWLVGVPFAALSTVLSYSVGGESGTYEIVGFPLAVAAIDEEGLNYVGRLSIPFLVANAAIWFFVPHILLYMWNVLARIVK